MTSVNKDMIILARDVRGWSQLELAKRIGVSQAKVSKYENGLLEVTDDDLRAICHATGFHASLFTSREPMYGLGSSVLFNRRKKTTPIAIQRIIQAKVNVARMQLLQLLKAAELEAPNPFERIDIESVDGDAAEAARRLRAAWRMPMGPVRNLTSAIEAAGGIVLLCDFGSEAIDAAHLWISGNPPMFFMNSNVPGDRYLFNLAHELAHAVMHQFPTGDVEVEANAFAAELLMPAQEIKRELNGNLTIQKLALLKQRWRVSMAALVYQAHRTGAITKSKKTSLYQLLSRLGYRKREPIEIQMEKPMIVRQLFDLHRKALGYTDDEILDVLMTDAPDFIQPAMKETRRSIRITDAPFSFEAHLKKRKA